MRKLQGSARTKSQQRRSKSASISSPDERRESPDSCRGSISVSHCAQSVVRSCETSGSTQDTHLIHVDRAKQAARMAGHQAPLSKGTNRSGTKFRPRVLLGTCEKGHAQIQHSQAILWPSTVSVKELA